jgi:flagellar M-ring protein FliF
VIPETKLFATTVVPVTASVLLRLRPGIELARGKISGIVHLVSSSVENLQPENVTVIDDTGKILSANIRLTAEVTTLAPVQPPAERPVMVAAVSPEIVVVLAETQAARTATRETVAKKITTKEVVAAAPEKISATFEVTKTASLSAEERIYLKAQAKKELERELSGKAQELVNRFYPPNSIVLKVGVEIRPAKEAEIRAKDLKLKRLEAIVLVDNRIDLNLKLKQATFTTVAAAIGYDKKRGDKIILQLVPFHLAVPPLPSAPPAPVTTGFTRITPIISLQGVLKWGAAVLAVLIAVWLAIFLIGRRRQGQAAEEEETRRPMVPAASQARERPPVLDQIRSQVEANPERIAELLKNWLSE